MCLVSAPGGEKWLTLLGVPSVSLAHLLGHVLAHSRSCPQPRRWLCLVDALAGHRQRRYRAQRALRRPAEALGLAAGAHGRHCVCVGLSQPLSLSHRGYDVLEQRQREADLLFPRGSNAEQLAA
jgi:hypothetical protein